MVKDYSPRKTKSTEPPKYTDSPIQIPDYEIVVPNHIYSRRARALHVCGFEHDGGFVFKLGRLETPTTGDISTYMKNRSAEILSGNGSSFRMLDMLLSEFSEEALKDIAKDGPFFLKNGKSEVYDTVAGELGFVSEDSLRDPEKILAFFQDEKSYVIQYFFSIINREVVNDIDVEKVSTFRDELVDLSKKLSRVFTDRPDDVQKLPYASHGLIERFLDYKAYLVLDTYVQFINSQETQKPKKEPKKKEPKTDRKDDQSYMW